MRQLRYIAPWHRADFSLSDADSPALPLEGKPALYHCISRIVGREFLLGDEEKNHFVKLMRLYERFCGVRVLSYCIMTNHFHLLVEIPSPLESPFSNDNEFLDHLALLCPEHQLKELREQLDNFENTGREAQAQELRDKYLKRMWNLSSFMKSLKQRFTQWYNGKHARKGVLWEDRFRSVLVEDGHAARVMSAYIDLNPVRAKMVEDAKDYYWSTWGQATRSNSVETPQTREGLRRVMMESFRSQYASEEELEKALTWRKVASHYRQLLNKERDDTQEIEKDEGALLQKKVKQFSRGVAIGSKEFVEGNFLNSRQAFGKNRRIGARKIKKSTTSLRALRDL